MKRILHTLLSVALAGGLLTSCKVEGDDVIWDIAPLVISVKVLSPDGYSVLNGSNAPQITATYRGKTYACSRRTRYYMPQFFGLAYANDYLLFGELNGDATYTDERLVIDWGDGSPEDVITFSHRIEWKNNEPHFRQTFYLNGKRVDGQITIYRDFVSSDSDEPRQEIPLTDAQRAAVVTINQMGLNLFQQMLADPAAAGRSIVASPLSVAFMLGMLADGAPAASETSQQLLRVLNGLTGARNVYVERSDHDELLKTLIDCAPLVDRRVDVAFANALCIRRDIPLYGGYPLHIADYYQADYMQLDFSSPVALGEINGWCRQKTQGLIPAILESVDPATVAAWLNTFYFKAGWAMPFDATASSQAPFTLPDGSRADRRMMHSALTTRFVDNVNAAIVALPFSNGAYEMDVVLPHEGRSFADVVDVLAAEQPGFLTWQKATVSLTMPAFHVESSHDALKHELQQMGITRLFAPAAELSDISSDAGLFISMVKQVARITIDEYGCEGGAPATIALDDSGIGSGTAAPIAFNANRPFLYLIREVSSGAILLIGTYCGELAKDQAD